MAIDRIGKGPPGGPAPPEAARKPGVGEVERPFAPAPGSPTGAAPAARPEAAGPSALDRLRAGELDLDGYLDAKVDEATRHIAGLPPSELAAIKEALRDELALDPALADLVARATGQRPGPLR
jgi:hypothetical protein